MMHRMSVRYARSPERRSATRVLGNGDVAAALSVLDRDPVTNVFVAARVRAGGLDPWRLGAEVWGYGGGRLESLCYSGANLVPVAATPEAVHAFARRALRQGRVCSSIVGPQDAVQALWAELEPHWGPAREVRPCQPVMATSCPPALPGDPAVRRVRPEEIDVLLPSCVAMYTEEVGVSPLGSDGGALYRSRVTELVAQGRSYARIEDGEVLFKAEIGAVTPQACQVQGVWVAPRLRGQGFGTAGMASVVRAALELTAPAVTLYVNDYNLAARRAYERVGFVSAGTFASVLF